MAWKGKRPTQCECSQGERWFILYNFLVQNSGKGRAVSRQAILNHLAAMGAEVSVHTLYSDIATLQGEVFNLDIELVRSAPGKPGGYWVKNPPL